MPFAERSRNALVFYISFESMREQIFLTEVCKSMVSDKPAGSDRQESSTETVDEDNEIMYTQPRWESKRGNIYEALGNDTTSF